MKIIILGAGREGAALAETLSNERNDITLVDEDGRRLRELNERLDLKVVEGHPSQPDVLEAAGAADAEMLIALTDSDEMNMVACRVAFALFKVNMKICRIRTASYIDSEKLFGKDGIAIDELISPEKIVSEYIKRLIDLPGSLQVLDFAQGRVQLVAVKASLGGPLVGQEIRLLRQHMPSIDARVAAIFRQDRPIKPEGSTVIEADDEVFFVAARENIRPIISELRRLDKPYRRLMIAGGGRVGFRFTQLIEHRYQVKLIEKSKPRCDYLSENLNHTIVLEGEATDKEILVEENVKDMDVFLALTNDDEANFMSSLLAKQLGAKKVITLINNPSYVDLVQGGQIDIAISPQQATVGSLLAHVRKGEVVTVHSLRRGAAEALETIAQGGVAHSKVVGKAVQDINLPEGTTIGAIVRKGEVLIAHDRTVVEELDHVILFLVNREQIPAVEKLFTPDPRFF